MVTSISSTTSAVQVAPHNSSDAYAGRIAKIKDSAQRALSSIPGKLVVYVLVLECVEHLVIDRLLPSNTKWGRFFLRELTLIGSSALIVLVSDITILKIQLMRKRP